MSVAATLLDLIARLRPLTIPGAPEHHYVVSPGSGEILSHLIGDDTEVITGNLANELLRDSITVHNHSGIPFPLSENDLVNALVAGERATFVVNAAGVGRWRTRWPAVDAEARFRSLLDAATTLEARAARRLGWYGDSKAVSAWLFARLPAAVEAEIQALVAAYPEFADYTFVPYADAEALRALLEC